MPGPSTFANKEWKLKTLLLLCSFGIYFFYFHHVMLNMNSVLSSITSDALKNYYTYVYHITNDSRLLHFEGMNYPFGEHVVYTDCQPILTFVLRLLPSTHPYLIGILHAIIFLSYIITPLIIYNILRRLDVDPLSSFFPALAIALLSPQFWRLDGHFALTYEWEIPLAILLLLRFFQQEQTRTLCWIMLYNTALFLLHPYLGLGLSIFCLIALLVFGLNNQKGKRMLRLVQAFITGLLPVILFKLFLFLTDPHQHRTNEPFGIDISVASIASVFVAGFGPFEKLMKTCISKGPQEFEGLAYLGFFTVLMILAFMLMLPFFFRTWRVKKELAALLTAALLLLFFSFGLHNQLLKLVHLRLAVFSQFRSLGRFAWFFYYVMPLFLVATFYHSFKSKLQPKRLGYVFGLAGLLFLSFNLLEAHYMFRVYANGSFKDRNIFRLQQLTAEEKQIVASMQALKPQAIIPLPVYYLGSEVYSRIGGGNSMLPSMIYSYHATTPIVGGSLSRTSITETEDAIELLNVYKRKRRAMELCNEQPFLVIKTIDPLFPDEERLFKKTQVFHRNDSSEIGYIARQELQKMHLHSYVYRLHGNSSTNKDGSNVLYIHWENRKPFLPARIMDYEKIAVLDSNNITTGRYVVSLHYYFAEKTYRDVFNHLIITRERGKEGEWKYVKPIRLMSGFYKGFAIFEFAFDLERENKYEFMLKGDVEESYRISDFLLRPDTTDVMAVTRQHDTLINNFPR